MEDKGLKELYARQLNGFYLFAIDMLKQLKRRSQILNKQNHPFPPVPPKPTVVDEVGPYQGSGGDRHPPPPPPPPPPPRIQNKRSRKALNMTRKRVKLTRMVNESARKSCLKKRRIGLFKKAEELSILCDLDMAAIVYSPGENDPAVWPSREVAERMLTKYLSMPEIERSKKTTTQDSYLRERTEKEAEKLKKIQKKNNETEMKEIMNQLMEGRDLNELDVRQLNGFYMFAADMLKQLGRRNRTLNRQSPPFPPAAAAPPPQPAAVHEAGPSRGSGGYVGTSIPTLMEPLMHDQWFMDTMTCNQNIAGPGEGGDMGLPPEYVAGTSGAKDDDLPYDFDRVWPDIFSP
ncbi:hypothetical protein F0562_017074 [Nyssa sinensis]|uniref:MADS-box domain-containing protein n=1 Tax=Nyssa sinensis TaxID=561372 RepID=A0A5J4ZGG4_9ASTE|nr:hypothetical protein F0562_017074 [Nyssa sinensis]